MGNYRKHHYIPQWYQYHFLEEGQNESKFYYLDLHPETIKLPNGKRYTRKNLLRWGPPSCFYKEGLYTTKFKEWESTEIEERFFGKVDNDGQKSVEYFADFGHPSANEEAFHSFLAYMSVQKLRTPKGIAYLSSISNLADNNLILMKMQEIHRMHCAIWTECVWSIVDASQSDTKFICSDHPVTVYNLGCFPTSKWCRGANDPVIWLNGTHTIFPLNLNKAIILTNLSWVRNPYGNPSKERPNSELFRAAMFNFTDIQTGRILDEEEVITINYIIKQRAFRYIASAKKEWLYPEDRLTFKRWDQIGYSYLLMPDPRSVTFSSGIIIGYDNNRSEAFDEYGRKPWHPDYKDQTRHNYEWDSFHAFKGEYARLNGPKRKGTAYNFSEKVESEDSADYHAYHLRLEQELKSKIKTWRK